MKHLLDQLWRAFSLRAGLQHAAFPGYGLSTTQPSWHRVRWTSRYWLRRLDWVGVLAIGMLTIIPAVYFSAIRPEQARLDAARHRVSTLQVQIALASKSLNGIELSPSDQLVVFYRKFPVEGQTPQLLEKLVALAANHGLSLNDGEYKATRDKVGRLVRYQVTLQVRGQYPQIRKFLTDLPDALPFVALENVQLERQKVADSKLEAKIKLLFYLEQAS